ncbi:MAG: ATP-binding protein, partial [Flavobacteriales bacterium]|nr:ATP-binding protein [Flavobacteriales bacterium]
LIEFKLKGITKVVFGDIALVGLKEYRDNLLSKEGMTGVYPLWKQPTLKLIYEFLDLKFSTTICCICTEFLTKDDVSQIIDNKYIEKLNKSIDPCGENGEFHTFCWDGPIFETPIQFTLGEKIFKPLQMPSDKEIRDDEGFWFCDLIPTT